MNEKKYSDVKGQLKVEKIVDNYEIESNPIYKDIIEMHERYRNE